MTPTNFVSTVTPGCPLPLPMALYPRIKAPPGIGTVYAPLKISEHEMAVRGRGMGLPSSTNFVEYGLTYPEFSVRFADEKGQWKHDPGGWWQFQGGDVILDVRVTVYVSKLYEVFAFKDEIFQLVISHELEHVRDHFDVIHRHLPQILRADAEVKKLLIDDGTGQPAKLPDGTYQHWFVDKVNDWGREWTRFGYRVFQLWAAKYSDLGEKLDNGARANQYRKNIDNLKHENLKSVKWPK
jgi:hypothetical protein